MTAAEKKKFAMPNWMAVALAIAIPLLLPTVFNSNYALSMMCQMGIGVIVALSYNMLLGQTGLLSFGPAVYSGLGGYFVIWLLNMASKGTVFPVTFLPLVGGAAGLVFALIFGWVTTKRAGTAFSMITMGIGELVAAATLVIPVFGGEGGVSSSRTTGHELFGINYGPAISVYYLIAIWAIICTALMYGLTRTPLGRMANAVRDNSERAQFVGYNPQRVRFMFFVLSGFFAGISGGLSAINFEIVTHEYFGAHATSVPLLMAYIGGIGYFFGPIIGAIVITILEVVVGAYTKAWPLYMGVIFIATVLFAPQGIAGIVMQHRNAWEAGLFRRLILPYLKAAVPALLVVLGVICVVEYTYHLKMEADAGTAMKLFGISLDAATATPWLVAIGSIVVGAVLLRFAKSSISHVWDDITKELQGGHH